MAPAHTKNNNAEWGFLMNNKLSLIFLVIALFLSAGCTVVHTVPLAARAGDSIMVSVGSPENLSKANTNLTYTPTGGSPITIPDTAIRTIFNLYPDKTSAAWLYSDASVIENSSGHGPWTTVLAVDLPNDGSLPVGTGSIQINTTANYNAPIPSPNGADVALEILPGTGSPSSFDYLGFGQVQVGADLTALAPMPRLQFKPTWTGYDASHTYGAVEVKIGIDKSGIAENDFNIVIDDKVGTLQTRNVHATWNAQRFETTVLFISPTGELQYSDVNFSVVSKILQSQFESGAQNVATNITINSVIWYDINGAVDPTGPAIEIVNLTGT